GIVQYQQGRRRPPEHSAAEQPGRQRRQQPGAVEQRGNRQGIGDPQRLRLEAGQACPFPGAEADHGTDEQGEPGTFQQEEATQSDGQQDQGGDDALFQHWRASASTCSLVLPKRRWRVAKSASALRMASCLKSGQYRSEKYSSE